MYKYFWLVLVVILLLPQSVLAFTEEESYYAKAHFENTDFPYAFEVSDEPVSQSEYLTFLKAYAHFRGLKEISFDSKSSKPMRRDDALVFSKKLLPEAFKKPSFVIPTSWYRKSLLTKRDMLLLLRKADTALGHPDLLVYGSELESVSAALSGKSEGLEVILVHEKPDIGGLAIDGGLNYIDIPQSDGEWLLQGFAKRFYEHMGNGYDFTKARSWLKKELKRLGVVTWQGSSDIKRLDKKGGMKIHHIAIGQDGFYPKMLIDASENGDLFAGVGAEYTKGLYKNEEVYPAASLLYVLEGVDYEKVKRHLLKDFDGMGNTGGVINKVAWGYKDEIKGYRVKDKNNVIRALNIAYIEEKDRVVMNHIFNTAINPLSEASKEEVKHSLREEAKAFLPYLKEHCVGFEKATLVGFANELYLRDSRHFKGSYTLKLKDLVNRTAFYDRVLITNYPIDIHATKNRKENLILYYPQSYEIPYRVMHNTTLTNLLVSSKCASYEPLVAGSTRIVMTGTMMSETAGVASALAIKENVAVQDVSIKALQSKLKERGFISTHPAPLKRELSFWALFKLSSGKYTYEELGS